MQLTDDLACISLRWLIPGALMVCSSAGCNGPAAPQGSSEGAATSPVSSPAASAAAASSLAPLATNVSPWEGFLAETLAGGLVYINDANAKDSQREIEAIIVPAAERHRFVEPGDLGQAGFTPTVLDALATGNAIIDHVGRESAATPGGDSPFFRYLMFGVADQGKRQIRARPLCVQPAWWASVLGPGQLCRKIGSCGPTGAIRNRGSCSSSSFDYDLQARTLVKR